MRQPKQIAKTIAITAEPTEPVEPEFDANRSQTIYEWVIPGDDGYNLDIKIEDAANVDEARSAALDYQIPTGSEYPRRLRAIEASWIASHEPFVVRNTDSITMGHEQALIDNERLTALNAAYEITVDVFKTFGIDVFNPQPWIDARMADAARCVADAQMRRDNEDKGIAAAFIAFKADLDKALSATRFAPPVERPVPEPDYSKLTIVADPSLDAAEYPRLSKASWTTHDLSEPLTDTEKQGLKIVLDMIDRYRFGVHAQVEQDQVVEAAKVIRMATGV